MKKYIVFLLPMLHAMEVIRAAKQHGYSIIALVNTPPSNLPPYGSAFACIDHCLMIDDWNDYDGIVNLLRQVSIDGQIVGNYFNFDSVAVLNTKLRTTFNLPGNSVATMELLTNKLRVRKALIQAKLSTLKFISSLEFTGRPEWSYPDAAYFKPVHGSGSLLVKRCTSSADLNASLATWDQDKHSVNFSADPYLIYRHIYNGSDDEWFLEEEIKGELLSVEALCHDGKFYPLGLLSRILFSENPVVEMGSCFPYPHPASEKIIAFVKQAHETLGIRYGATHTELIIDKAGHMEIIDLNPRFVGADVIMSINNAYATNIEDRLLEVALREQLQWEKMGSAHQFACLQYVLPPQEIEVFESITLPEADEVVFKRACVAPGAILKSKDGQLDVVGVYLTLGDSFDATIKRSYELRKQVRVNGKYLGRF